MKKSEVKIGQVYSVKVSGSMAPVRIDRENPRGGWDGTNMKTKKAVRIKSAQRLRGKAASWPVKKSAKSADGVAETVAAVQKGDLTKGVKVPTAKKKRGGITEATKAGAVDAAMQAVAADKKKRASGLDAAAQVLAEAGEPLNTKTMVERMLAKGLWKTNGKTPAATIYAAIIREIATKGAGARFRKVDRGRFELAK
ncbi:hypothetical protein LCGC14_1349850 [marine sediment metagenome]|uniref:HTH HARE-type domain-containing protein n=1 Tax=marine sediment metagenome TaxID=412755 RepID=A0A0F9MS18_9ZZZZ